MSPNPIRRSLLLAIALGFLATPFIWASTSRRFWQLGARTTRFSCPRAPRRSSVTFQTLTCASSRPATSPSRRIVTRSLRQSAISCHAPN